MPAAPGEKLCRINADRVCPPPSRARVKRLYCAANFTEAHLLRQLLAQQGIAIRVFNENAQSALGEIPFTHAYPELWLEHERDEARARALLRDYERGAATQPRPCSVCQESNPANFDLCWQCGAALS